jgi:hypothetical protein
MDFQSIALPAELSARQRAGYPTRAAGVFKRGERLPIANRSAIHAVLYRLDYFFGWFLENSAIRPASMPLPVSKMTVSPEGPKLGFSIALVGGV